MRIRNSPCLKILPTILSFSSNRSFSGPALFESARSASSDHLLGAPRSYFATTAVSSSSSYRSFVERSPNVAHKSFQIRHRADELGALDVRRTVLQVELQIEARLLQPAQNVRAHLRVSAHISLHPRHSPASNRSFSGRTARGAFRPRLCRAVSALPFQDESEMMMDRRARDSEPLRDDPDRRAALLELERAFDLGRRDHAPRPPEPSATSSSALEPRARAFAESNTLLLGYPREDRDEQIAYRSARVEPRFAHADHSHAQAVELDDRVEVAHHRATEPVERPDDQRGEVTATRIEHHLDEPRPRCVAAAASDLDVLMRHVEPTSSRQPVDVGALVGSVLRSRRDASIGNRSASPTGTSPIGEALLCFHDYGQSSSSSARLTSRMAARSGSRRQPCSSRRSSA